MDTIDCSLGGRRVLSGNNLVHGRKGLCGTDREMIVGPSMERLWEEMKDRRDLAHISVRKWEWVENVSV